MKQHKILEQLKYKAGYIAHCSLDLGLSAQAIINITLRQVEGDIEIASKEIGISKEELKNIITNKLLQGI